MLSGILIYEMVHGFPPFSDENNLNTYRKILSGQYPFSQSQYYSSEAKDKLYNY